MKNKIKLQAEVEALLPLREQMLLPLAVVGVCCFIPFAVFNFARQDFLLGLGILLVTLVFLFNGFSIYRTRKVLIPFEILFIPAAASILLSITHQGVYGTYWCYPMLLFLYFVLSRRTANLCGVLLLGAVTLVVLQHIGRDVATRFAVSLVLLMVMANIIVGAIEDLHHRLIEQTIKDPLTGAFNRRYLESRLNDALARKNRASQATAILTFDIDFFKRINDELGHASGDEVLKSLVKIINNRIRQSDKLFRIGGEEFLLFLPETDEAKAAHFAEELREMIAESALLDDRSVTISVGISELRRDDSVETWLKSADEALYQAKAAGRNRAVLRASPAVFGEGKTIGLAG